MTTPWVKVNGLMCCSKDNIILVYIHYTPVCKSVTALVTGKATWIYPYGMPPPGLLCSWVRACAVRMCVQVPWGDNMIDWRCKRAHTYTFWHRIIYKDICHHSGTNYCTLNWECSGINIRRQSISISLSLSLHTDPLHTQYQLFHVPSFTF